MKGKGKVKIIGKAIIPFFIAIVILTSCNGFISTPTMSPTNIAETSIALAGTEVVETQATDPTSEPSIIQFMATTLPLTEPSIPTIQNSPIPVPVTPTIVVLENRITWTECIAPSIDYAHSVPDFEFAANCFHEEIPTWNYQDLKIAGEWIGDRLIDADLQQVIGSDVYLVKQDHTNDCCDYKFLKNGNVIIETSAPMITFNPNQHLWNIGGQVIWELVADPPTIFVDGVDFNQKHQWEGIFKPYTINNKLLYIAKKNGKYHVVYDEEIIGPEFDEIYIKYCCGTTNVQYGSGRYWFWGKREGMYYIVEIQ